jgi:hypothetical protein
VSTIKLDIFKNFVSFKKIIPWVVNKMTSPVRRSKRSKRSGKKLSAYQKFVKNHIKKLSGKPTSKMSRVAAMWRKQTGAGSKSASKRVSKRKSSPKRKSPKRKSPKRKSTARKSRRSPKVRRCTKERVAECRASGRVCQRSRRKGHRQSCRISRSS